jgi:hypothetical protein
MKSVPLQTEQDVHAVKTCLILPVLMDVLERDIGTLNTLKLKMPAIYVRTLRAIQTRVAGELSAAHKGMRGLGIRIYGEERTRAGLTAQYLCRGYHHSILLLWDLVKADIEVRLAAYLNLDLEAADTQGAGVQGADVRGGGAL